MYEQVYERGYSNQSMIEQLGNVYYFNARYGETQLINGCADGVDYSEAEHQMNRGSKFIITKK